ncbi:MAG: HAD family phosphatase [Bacteroidota bacterium]
MKEIKNIIFDLGGVILPIDISRTTEAYRKLGISNIEELFAHGHADSFFKEYEKGEIDDKEFVDRIKKSIRDPVGDEVIIDAWNALLLDFPLERIDFLKNLQSRYKLFLFSNTNAIHHTAFHKKYRELSNGENFDNLFKKAWYSHLIKMRKPDLSAFHFIISQAGIDPGESLFVDDALVNVEGALQAGLHAVHLSPGKTIFDLGL